MTGSEIYTIEKIKSLIREFKFTEAMVHAKLMSGEERIHWVIFTFRHTWHTKSTYLMEDLIPELIEPVVSSNGEGYKPRTLAAVYHFLAGDELNTVDWEQDELDLFLEYHARSKSHIENISEEDIRTFWDFNFLVVQSIYEYNTLSPEKALEAFEACLSRIEGHWDKERIATAHWNMGAIYQVLGEFERSIYHYKKYPEILMPYGIYRRSVMSYLPIATMYFQMGDLDQAHEYASDCIRYGEGVAHHSHYLGSIKLMAEITYTQQSYDLSLKYCEELLKQYEYLEDDSKFRRSEKRFNRVKTMDLMIRIYLKQNLLQQAETTLTRMEQEVGKDVTHLPLHRGLTKIPPYQLKLSKARILLSQTGLASKFKAAELLEEIKSGDHNHIPLRVSAIIELAGLKLIELRLEGPQQLISEVTALIQELQALAETQHSKLLHLRVLVLLAKLESVKGDLSAAIDLFEKVIEMARTNGYATLYEEYSAAKQALEDNISQWQEILDHNPSISKRIEKAKFLEYIESMRQFSGFDEIEWL